MTLFRRISFFLLTNFLVLISVSIIAAVINTILFGEAFPANNSMTLIMVWSVVWGMGGAFISLMLSKTLAKRGMGLKMIDPQTAQGMEKEIVEMVHNLARQARLPKMPEVGIYPSEDVNAFATGPSKSNSLVAVSTGLLNSMNRDQVEGVLGHEVAHIANGDMVTMTLIQGVVNAFVLFFARIIANIVASSISDDERGGSFFIYFAIYMVLQVVFGILGMVVVGYFSRQREFRADKGGAKYAGREKMISALQALMNAAAHQMPQQKPKEQDRLAALKISNRRGGGILALIGTHPPLEARITRLQRGH